MEIKPKLRDRDRHSLVHLQLKECLEAALSRKRLLNIPEGLQKRLPATLKQNGYLSPNDQRQLRTALAANDSGYASLPTAPELDAFLEALPEGLIVDHADTLRIHCAASSQSMSRLHSLAQDPEAMQWAANRNMPLWNRSAQVWEFPHSLKTALQTTLPTFTYVLAKPQMEQTTLQSKHSRLRFVDRKSSVGHILRVSGKETQKLAAAGILANTKGKIEIVPLREVRERLPRESVQFVAGQMLDPQWVIGANTQLQLDSHPDPQLKVRQSETDAWQQIHESDQALDLWSQEIGLPSISNSSKIAPDLPRLEAVRYSLGHLGIVNAFEYYALPNGEVVQADSSHPLDEQGYRPGTVIATKTTWKQHAVKQFLDQLGQIAKRLGQSLYQSGMITSLLKSPSYEMQVKSSGGDLQLTRQQRNIRLRQGETTLQFTIDHHGLRYVQTGASPAEAEAIVIALQSALTSRDRVQPSPQINDVDAAQQIFQFDRGNVTFCPEQRQKIEWVLRHYGHDPDAIELKLAEIIEPIVSPEQRTQVITELLHVHSARQLDIQSGCLASPDKSLVGTKTNPEGTSLSHELRAKISAEIDASPKSTSALDRATAPMPQLAQTAEVPDSPSDWENRLLTWQIQAESLNRCSAHLQWIARFRAVQEQRPESFALPERAVQQAQRDQSEFLTQWQLQLNVLQSQAKHLLQLGEQQEPDSRIFNGNIYCIEGNDCTFSIWRQSLSREDQVTRVPILEVRNCEIVAAAATVEDFQRFDQVVAEVQQPVSTIEVKH